MIRRYANFSCQQWFIACEILLYYGYECALNFDEALTLVRVRSAWEHWCLSAWLVFLVVLVPGFFLAQWQWKMMQSFSFWVFSMVTQHQSTKRSFSLRSVFCLDTFNHLLPVEDGKNMWGYMQNIPCIKGESGPLGQTTTMNDARIMCRWRKGRL